MHGTEKASIDEAYLDFTQPVRDLLIERYPHLATLPPDAPFGLDTPLPPAPRPSYDDLGHILPFKSESAASEIDGDDDGLVISSSPFSSDEAVSWADIAVSIGAELMLKCRTAVKEELGYTCSAGIAPNKVSPALASRLTVNKLIKSV